jgi:hypothetical protein
VSCSAVPLASADGTCQAAVPNVSGHVTVSDSCSGTNAITVTQSPAAGTLVGLGTNTITVTATDEAGNSAICTTTFTVSDTTAPSVSCSVALAASADGACQAAMPNVLGAVTVSDSCSATNAITVTQSPVAGTLVGLGTNTITVTATDAAGNSATCTTTFTVTPASCSAISLQPAEYDGQHFTLEWNGVTGMSYQVQSSADLVNWLDAGSPVGDTNSIQRWTDEGSFASPGPPGSPRFYRVKELL